MIQSMTGFAAASADTPRGRLAVELRSVNARFLDLQFRIADELRASEPLLRELLQARLARGKVDCRVFLADDAAGTAGRLSADAVARLRELSAQVLQEMPQAAPLRVGDVLRWPGVIVESPLDEEQTRRLAADVCARALDELVASRSREGAKLAAAIAERVAAMRRRLEQVAPLVPQSLAAYQARLAERLKEAIGSALGSIDDRVRAELAVFAAKADVDEELTRLKAHLGEVDRALSRGGAVGKRLDFLAQELNREANTLASKAASQEIGDCALELKLLVEQMREQVQNIE
ncbi:MAG TPA: YicC/YloC family endoribonuclease [Burkholderiales bacterium]|nr:YicC/YloC family endoribonuclease [Burkholderiales bacterium]